jgi:hypothetical protein
MTECQVQIEESYVSDITAWTKWLYYWYLCMFMHWYLCMLTYLLMHTGLIMFCLRCHLIMPTCLCLWFLMVAYVCLCMFVYLLMVYDVK